MVSPGVTISNTLFWEKQISKTMSRVFAAAQNVQTSFPGASSNSAGIVGHLSAS